MHPCGMQNAREYPRFSTERFTPTEWQIRCTLRVIARFASLRAQRSNRSEAELGVANPAPHALRCRARISGLLRYARNDARRVPLLRGT
jgi:hypothetical protein